MQTSPKHVIRPRTLTAIVDAAIRLFSQNAGTSMSEVAREAGVGRATLHRHFRTKSELVNAIGIRCIEEMNAAVLTGDLPNLPAIERLRLMLEAVIPLGDRYGFLRFVASSDKEIEKGYLQQLDWAFTLVQDLKSEGTIATDVPSRWVVAQIDQLVWTAWTAVSTWRFTSEEATSLALRTLMQGLKA